MIVSFMWSAVGIIEDSHRGAQTVRRGGVGLLTGTVTGPALGSGATKRVGFPGVNASLRQKTYQKNFWPVSYCGAASLDRTPLRRFSPVAGSGMPSAVDAGRPSDLKSQALTV